MSEPERRLLVCDLPREAAAMADAVLAATTEVVRSGWFVLGEQGRAFDREFGAWLSRGAAAPVVSAGCASG